MSKYEELVQRHEAIGSVVSRKDRTLYVECMVDGKRFGPPGVVLSADQSTADVQAAEYLATTLPLIEERLRRGA